MCFEFTSRFDFVRQASNRGPVDSSGPRSRLRGDLNFLLAALVAASLLVALLFTGGAARAGTLATTPNDLLGGLTAYDIRNYENVYDSNGNPVTSSASAGDSIQGVFVVTHVSNAAGTANYAPQFSGAVELTGAFDAYISGINSAGNYILVPDSTAVVGQKAMSGSAFQTSYGTGAMLAVYYNNVEAMPVGLNGNGISGLSTAAQAVSLATDNGGNGAFWASFGANGTWGDSNGYFWGDGTADGVSTFAASLGMVTNDTGLPSSDFQPLTQAGPVTFNEPALLNIPNPFIIQGTTTAEITGPYAVFSTDPAQLDFVTPVPEPSSLMLIAATCGALAVLRILRRKLA